MYVHAEIEPILPEVNFNTIHGNPKNPIVFIAIIVRTIKTISSIGTLFFECDKKPFTEKYRANTIHIWTAELKLRPLTPHIIRRLTLTKDFRD